jgi:hypothetical protein
MAQWLGATVALWVCGIGPCLIIFEGCIHIRAPQLMPSANALLVQILYIASYLDRWEELS